MIDLDNCIPPESGHIHPNVQNVIDRFASYTEFSVSVTSVHTVIEATLPPGPCRVDDLEMYCRDRFIAITGDRLPGTPASIEPRQAEPAAFHADIFPSASVTGGQASGARPKRLTESEALRRARSAGNSRKFRQLYDGEGHTEINDCSTARFALLSLLTHWCCDDAEQIGRLFRRSVLYDARRDENRGNSTYGAGRVKKVIESHRNFDESGSARPGGDRGRSPLCHRFRVTSSLGTST